MFEYPYFPSVISGTLLLLAAWMALQCWRALHRTEPAAFWGLAAVGLAWLSVDELFGIHERVARRLFPDLGVVNNPDDVIIMAYAVASVLIGLTFWQQITAEPRAFRLLCGAALATAIAGALDGFGVGIYWLSVVLEELFEWSAGAMALLAMRMRLDAARGAAGDGRHSASDASPSLRPGTRPG